MKQEDNKKEMMVKQQRDIIREFDKELFTYTGQIAWFLPGIFSFLLICLMAIPFQEVGPGDYIIWVNGCNFSAWISYLVLQPYLYTTDTFSPRNTTSITYNKLRYLPVSRKQYNRVRLGYVIRYVWKLTLIGLTVQCLSAFLTTGTVTVWNVLYGIGILFVAPLLIGWLQLMINR